MKLLSQAYGVATIMLALFGVSVIIGSLLASHAPPRDVMPAAVHIQTPAPVLVPPISECQLMGRVLIHGRNGEADSCLPRNALWTPVPARTP